MISLVERKCSWCRHPYPIDNHPLLCDTCYPKFYRQSRFISINHKSSSDYHSSKNLQDHSSEHKEIKLETSDQQDKLCCNGILFGKFLGHQIVSIDKGKQNMEQDEQNNRVDQKSDSSRQEIRDEEFQEKKDGLCKDLEHGFEACLERLEILEHSLKKQIEERNSEQNRNEESYSIVKLGKEENVLDCLSYLRKEVDRVMEEMKHWIDELRNKASYEKVNGLKVFFNVADFIDLLHCVCHMGNANKIKSFKKDKENNNLTLNVLDQQQKEKKVNQNQSHLSHAHHNEDHEEEVLELIASNFMIQRKGHLAEFEQIRKRRKFQDNLRLARNWGTYNLDQLRLILTSSTIHRNTIKECLDYIFKKGYFTKVEIIIKIDIIKETTAAKFNQLFEGVSYLKTLAHVSIEIIDTAQAYSNGDGLLAFIQGRLPKGISKKLILGSVVMSVSSDLAQGLSKLKTIETVILALKAYEIDNLQLINIGTEWSNLIKLQNFRLSLSACNLITSTAIGKFIEAISQQGSELAEVNLDIQECEFIDEKNLDNVLQSQNQISLID